MTRTALALGLTAVLMASTGAVSAAEAWRTSGFDVPESVVFDADNSRLIVSNIVGEATEADGNGTLSLVSLDGEIIDAAWVTGLDAPKGSAIAGGKLYVADLTNLRIVDLASGEVETLAIEGATFLNDVTADSQGTIYVTDTFANRIYAVAGNEAALFVEDAALGSPNGILADGDSLLVASFGTLAAKPEDMVPGGLVRIDIATKAVSAVEGADKIGFLDGIVRIGDAYVVSDFFGGTIYSVTPGSAPETVATLAMGAADIGSDGEAIFVPMMMEGELVKLTLE
ncbi:MAG: SMP-30/gluconolactonase/LRE family protein [Devosia sp.]|uniref:SMP-30/gluconolactonase/LRE family protein n=1 Tax=Devosia sp. TaxID=1871048 RepID=UPI0019DBB080|nr:ATP/GTP-binding protein [Devosia sp.]MBF0677845.1 SMP-30/gluconolactonase/LRE family protein [Devosia sp.]